eukprot:6506456-Alexandrium_andersonii.AAC.1
MGDSNEASGNACTTDVADKALTDGRTVVDETLHEPFPSRCGTPLPPTASWDGEHERPRILRASAPTT